MSEKKPPQNRHVVIGYGKVTTEYPAAPPPPPKTPAEIMAAKEYLREAFADAVARFDTFANTASERRWQKITDDFLKSRGMTEDQIATRRAEARQGLVNAVNEVTGRTKQGECILDRTVEIWQATGDLPPYLDKSFNP